MHTCYIGIGSNLEQPVAKAKLAIAALKLLPHSQFLLASSLYCSKPMGPSDQPDYINAVAAIKTSLAPLALLDELQKIEQQQGRTRKAERWGPRTLDLDLLLFGNEIIDTERLTVPHYGMKQREFVLYPLSDIAPDLILPCGKTLSIVVKNCPLNDLQVYCDN
jgi:2-amino-4-hydroxy-6-hydroxymethyldihydropteridine diphosphokinase